MLEELPDLDFVVIEESVAYFGNVFFSGLGFEFRSRSIRI